MASQLPLTARTANSTKSGTSSTYVSCFLQPSYQKLTLSQVRGSAQAGAYVASDPIGSKSTCPSSGIKYLPKSGSPAPTGSDPEPTTPAPTAAPTSSSGGSNGTQPVPTPAPQPGTGAAFSGRGYLNVASGGCLISTGKWLVGGTCATYTATPVTSSTFTLKSSKGACGLVSGVFTCGSAVSSTTFSVSLPRSNLFLFRRGRNTDFSNRLHQAVN